MTATVRSALAVAVGARVPVLLWGGPGLGKTSAVREMAAAADLPCEVVIASIREPSDFAGLPVVSDDTHTVHLSPPAWAQRLADAGRGVLFLDEISTAPPAVQAALLRVVLERTVGDLQLPDTVTVVAAANPPEQAADGWDLSPPLANRFCHLDWVLEPAEWSAGILGGFVPHPVPVIDDEALDRGTTIARGTIGAFVTTRPALFHAPPTDETAAGRAWPSPRAWDMAARLLAAAEIAGATDTVAAFLAAGAVGPAAALEFLAWRNELDLPDAEEVLRDPSSFRLPPRGDRAYAALTSLTAAVLAQNTPDRWQAAWQAIAAGTNGAHADIAVAAVRSLLNHRPDGATPPRGVLVTMAPVLRAAGLFERLTAAGD
jgi:MoxR-like ATPase